MKKHLVMIVGGYEPNPSPTGQCAERYVSLVQDKFEVDVICLARKDTKLFDFNGQHVHPVAPWWILFQNRVEKIKPLFILMKVITHVHNSFGHPYNLRWFIKSAYNELEKINTSSKVDVVFSVGAPTSSHIAARMFKSRNSSVKWVSYTVDSYAAQNNNKKKYLEFEKDLLSSSDTILLSDEIMDNLPFLYNKDKNNVMALPYMLPDIKRGVLCSEYKFDSAYINLVYAGRFYKDIRNPEFLLRTAGLLKENVRLHLFCASDCDNTINDLVKVSNGIIIRHALVPSKDIAKVYAAADVLVSVGNNTPEFKPSKTFEYIATGKPIINIYYPGVRDMLLDKYPLVCQIDNTIGCNTASKIINDFVSKRETEVPKDEIESIFSRHSQLYIKNILESSFA